MVDNRNREALRNAAILLCVCIPSFMINLDANIVAVSLSSIARAFEADFAQIEWVISAYTLAFASLVMAAGALADRYGRKRILVAGLTIFTLASLVCGGAPSISYLNVARAVQGVGAAMQLSAALAILSHEFRGAARARAFAIWGTVVGIAISLGPLVGGLITDAFGWEWAFYINVPIGVLLIWMALWALTESSDPRAARIDLVGVTTFSGSLFLITLALISGGRRGWTDEHVIAEMTGAVVLLNVFATAEKHQQRPMLDLRLFALPTFLGANIAAAAFAASLLTMLTYLPIFFQNGLGASPKAAGLMMMPLALPLFIIPRIVASYLSHRLTGRALLSSGLVIVGVGLAWLGSIVSFEAYSAMIGGLFVTGCGAGILNGEVTKVGMSVIPPERAGMASGVSGTIRFTGIVVGFAALGAVLSAAISHAVRAGLPAEAQIVADALARNVAAGDLSGVVGDSSKPFLDVAVASYIAGYRAILLSAAGVSIVAGMAAWRLVRAEDTMPVPRNVVEAPTYAPMD